ncbi:MAG: hypothetical protein C0506_01540 [Anaerolinea sp.]|nr:hypothetical protein [Anaerolinea sp.]
MPLPDRGLLPDQKVAQLAVLFEHAGIPHAFGGAMALVYWSEPRGTVDIDINVFLPAMEYARVFSTLNGHGIATTPEMEKEAIGREQVRIDWGGTPIDLFFAYDRFHDSCNERSVVVDFYGQPIRVLAAEDIVIFKALYNRPKDWPDIEQLLAVQGPAFDAGYVRDWIGRMLPAADSARNRLETLLSQYSGTPQ